MPQLTRPLGTGSRHVLRRHAIAAHSSVSPQEAVATFKKRYLTLWRKCEKALLRGQRLGSRHFECDGFKFSSTEDLDKALAVIMTLDAPDCAERIVSLDRALDARNRLLKKVCR